MVDSTKARNGVLWDMEWFRDAVRGEAQPLPGVRDWLKSLQAAGCSQGVASSAPPSNIDALMDRLGLRAYFDELGSGVDLTGKPDPAVFLKVARPVWIALQIGQPDELPVEDVAKLHHRHTHEYGQ